MAFTRYRERETERRSTLCVSLLQLYYSEDHLKESDKALDIISVSKTETTSKQSNHLEIKSLDFGLVNSDLKEMAP